ncbi:MAG: transcriptional repressor [Pseudomonadota bacterium]
MQTNSYAPPKSSRGSATNGRLTRNDQVVLACLQRHKRPMKAYDLLESLRHEGINAPMTVYRALGRLTGHGKVVKIESINAFYAIPEDGQQGVGAFFICAKCGTIAFRMLDPDAVANLADGLDVEGASIELRTGCMPDGDDILSGSCS